MASGPRCTPAHPDSHPRGFPTIHLSKSFVFSQTDRADFHRADRTFPQTGPFGEAESYRPPGCCQPPVARFFNLALRQRKTAPQPCLNSSISRCCVCNERRASKASQLTGTATNAHPEEWIAKIDDYARSSSRRQVLPKVLFGIVQPLSLRRARPEVRSSSGDFRPYCCWPKPMALSNLRRRRPQVRRADFRRPCRAAAVRKIGRRGYNRGRCRPT